MDKLKDDIYHADDLLDEIATEAMQSKLDSEFPGSSTTTTQTVSDLLVSWSPFSEGRASRIEQIIEGLEDFVNAKDSLGLREVNVGRNNPSHRLPPTTSLVDQLSVYGRDDDKEKLIQVLTSDADSSGHQVSVIPIVGMGGIGKTTLAQLVYNDPRVDDHFDIKSWVCVSEELDILGVTKTILEGLTRKACYTNDLNLLQVDLKNSLAGKKFVIVLDDVWNENKNNWDRLRSPFGVGKHGSTTVVTTRNEGVATIMRNVPIIHLEKLSNEVSWQLFSKQAFENGGPSVPPNLEIIGRKIVEKCKGLPLAAKTLGGFLRYKVGVEEWTNVLESQIWDFSNNQSDILPALLLSYHHLPSHLKLCFAYCAIIPKDYAFKKDELVPLWIAEGFVQWPRTSRSIEERGDDYFNELTSRSLFQQSSEDKFLMHDLINDLAQFVAGKYFFKFADDHQTNNDFSKVRYFSYFRQHYKFDVVAAWKAINEANYIRTFQSFIPDYQRASICNFDEKVLHDMLRTLRCLRVLSLSHYAIVELPDSIGNLIHLRYLDLSSTRIRCLPETISRLCNLETLLLKYCEFLTGLPTYLCKLTFLRHLNISGTNLREMPMQIGRLTSLQCLTDFIVGNQTGSAISELKELRHLRGTQCISNLQNVLNVRDASEANLKSKKHLEKLNLRWGRGAEHIDDSQKEKEREVIEKLQPHINLKHLTIENFGGTRFPDWLGDRSFLNLKSLCLRSCTYCDELPPLGQLPSLQELAIERMNSVIKVCSEFYEHDSTAIKPFQSLEKLTFNDMPEWEEWSILGAGEFCNLVELRIRNCPKLSGEFSNQLPYLKELSIDGCQSLLNLDGLQNLKSLQSLVIKDCPNMVSIGGGGLPAPNLTSIQIYSCKKLKALPEQMCTLLSSLQSLWMNNLPEIESFPLGGLPSSLNSLTIWDCDKLMARRTDWGLQRLPSLRYCEIGGECEEEYKKLLLESSSFPEECLFPTSLTHLTIYNRPNMKSLNPNGLRHLNSLQNLVIGECPELQSLLDEGLPSSLLSLTIVECPLLKVRCQREKGEDWLKISLIPYIYLDGEQIHS